MTDWSEHSVMYEEGDEYIVVNRADNQNNIPFIGPTIRVDYDQHDSDILNMW